VDDTEYLKLWNSGIRPHSKIVEEITGLKFELNSQQRIHREYEVLRTMIHAEMQNGFNHIDRHKIAAAMMFAIAKATPFQSGPNASFAARLASELLGVMTGFQIICDLVRSNPESDTVKKQIFGARLILPQPAKDNYLIFLAKLIYKAKIKGCTAENILMLSNALYVLEEYHDREARAELSRGL
jgi:hypothetical protein